MEKLCRLSAVCGIEDRAILAMRVRCKMSNGLPAINNIGLCRIGDKDCAESAKSAKSAKMRICKTWNENPRVCQKLWKLLKF